MKKNFLLMALTAVVLAMGFVSCSDDDDKPELIIDPVEEIAGSYTGGIYAAFGYMGTGFMPQADQTINITYNEDGETVKVTFDNETWGSFVFDHVTVSITEGNAASFELEGEGTCLMPKRGPNNTTGPAETEEYPATFKGTLTLAHNLVAELTVPVMGSTTIYFNPANFDEVYNAANQAE